MSIEFDADQQFKSRNVINQSQTSGMVKFLMKIGLIKDESKAGKVLISIIIIDIIAIVLIAYFFLM